MRSLCNQAVRRGSGAMSGSRFGVGERVARVSRLGRLAAAVALDSVAGQNPAGAAGCGMHLGTTQPSGALGSLIFDTTVVPAVPGQVCNATISVTATIATAGGIRP